MIPIQTSLKTVKLILLLRTNELPFADTANLDEIIKANEMGVIQGVTTNPSIIAKEPTGSFDSLIEKLARYCGKEGLSLSVEVFAEGYEPMVEQFLKYMISLLVTAQSYM